MTSEVTIDTSGKHVDEINQLRHERDAAIARAENILGSASALRCEDWARLEQEREEALKRLELAEVEAQRLDEAGMEIAGQRDAALARAGKAEGYAVTLQRVVEALSRGTQLPDVNLSPHVIGLATELQSALAQVKQVKATRDAALAQVERMRKTLAVVLTEYNVHARVGYPAPETLKLAFDAITGPKR